MRTPGELRCMYLPLQEGVQAGVIDVAGWIVGVGGLLAVVLWFVYLMR